MATWKSDHVSSDHRTDAFHPAGCQRRADAWRAVAVCGLLVVAVLLAFGRTLGQGFFNYDDGAVRLRRAACLGGLLLVGDRLGLYQRVRRRLVSAVDAFAHARLPAVWPEAGRHHLTNVLLHAASAVTLFLVLWRMTGGLWPSALVAALFALHPLHVESVAWIAERRDVLSGLFFMLTLGAYGDMSAVPHRSGAISPWSDCWPWALAKSMLVTLPPLLLLLDFWPLGRLPGSSRQPPQPAASARSRAGRQPTSFPWRVDLGKAAAVGRGPGRGRRQHGSPRALDDRSRLTLPERLANAAVSCVAYLGQLFVPVGLSVFYSYPESGWPAWQVAAARGAAVGDHGGRGDLPAIGSLLFRRLVLVRRHAASGAR